MKQMELIGKGKVRDTYRLSDEHIAVVASDRVSAFDKVIPDLEIQGKGQILTEMSERWSFLIDIEGDNGEKAWADQFVNEPENSFYITTAYAENDFSSIEFRDGAEEFFAQPEFDGRTQIQLELNMLPVECIVRGYITGSLWKAYKEYGIRNFYGIVLPDGLKEAEKLPEPIFTPTTKAPVGFHDEDICFEDMVKLIKTTDALRESPHTACEIARAVRSASLFYFKKASEYAKKRGIIIADTKFEFGLKDGWLYLADEILTPDSSRFWPLDEYAPGRPQRSLDKQIIRNYIKQQQDDGATSIDELPPEIIEQTKKAYQTITDMLFS